MSANRSALIVPLRPVGSQALNVVLGGQVCNIRVYGKQINVPVNPSNSIVTDPPVFETIFPVFMDLDLNDSLIISSVLCLNLTLIVRDTYFGFVGDFVFVDTQGTDDPLVEGLGSRWQLVYLPNAS